MGVNYMCFTSGTSDSSIKCSGERRLRFSFRVQLLHLTNTEYMSTQEKLQFLCQQDVESSPEEPQRGGQRWFRYRVGPEFGTWNRPVRVSRDQQVHSWVRRFIFLIWRLWLWLAFIYCQDRCSYVKTCKKLQLVFSADVYATMVTDLFVNLGN